MHKRDDIDDLLDELETDIGLHLKKPVSQPSPPRASTNTKSTTTTIIQPPKTNKPHKKDEIDGLLEELDMIDEHVPKPSFLTATQTHRRESSSSSVSRREKCNPVCVGGVSDGVGLSGAVRSR